MKEEDIVNELIKNAPFESGRAPTKKVRQRRDSKTAKYRKIKYLEMAIREEGTPDNENRAFISLQKYNKAEISINRACILAGLQEERFSCVMIPENVLNNILKHFDKKEALSIATGILEAYKKKAGNK